MSCSFCSLFKIGKNVYESLKNNKYEAAPSPFIIPLPSVIFKFSKSPTKSNPPLPPSIEILEKFGLAFKVYICFELYAVRPSLREKYFWSVFSRIRTEYGELLCISPYSAQMPGNTDQQNSEYGHFSRSALFLHSHLPSFNSAVTFYRIYSLSANHQKWLVLSLFDHFVELMLKGCWCLKVDA